MHRRLVFASIVPLLLASAAAAQTGITVTPLFGYTVFSDYYNGAVTAAGSSDRATLRLSFKSQFELGATVRYDLGFSPWSVVGSASHGAGGGKAEICQIDSCSGEEGTGDVTVWQFSAGVGRRLNLATTPLTPVFRATLAGQLSRVTLHNAGENGENASSNNFGANAGLSADLTLSPRVGVVLSLNDAIVKSNVGDIFRSLSGSESTQLNFDSHWMNAVRIAVEISFRF